MREAHSLAPLRPPANAGHPSYTPTDHEAAKQLDAYLNRLAHRIRRHALRAARAEIIDPGYCIGGCPYLVIPITRKLHDAFAAGIRLAGYEVKK